MALNAESTACEAVARARELRADKGSDKIFGDKGDDLLFSFNPQGPDFQLEVDVLANAGFQNDGGSTVDGGSGNDTIVVSHDFSGTMAVKGGDGNDTLEFGGDSNVFNDPAGFFNIIDLGAAPALPLSVGQSRSRALRT